jgi:YD repeat-containing protein
VQRAYKPYTATLGSSHTYDASFSSNASSYYTNQGVVLGGFPYSETQYQANPLNRMQKQSAPGATYALGSGKEVKMDYWSESANKYFVTRKKDEQDQSQRTSADLFGNTMQTVTDSAGLNLTTSFTYNTLGQLLSSTPPLGANYKSTYSYTTRGEMTSKTTPDAGTVQYLYDKAGRVRLVKDANHTGSTVGFNTVSGTIPMNRLVTGNVTLDMPGSVTISTGTAYQGPPTDNITLRLKKNGALIAQVQTNGMLQISLPRGTFAYEAQTPAGGNSLFTYNLSCSNCLELIYMKYDGVGRLLEEGEFMGTSATADFTQANADNTSWPSTGRIWLKTLTYDLPSTDPVASGQRNLHGQVSTAASYGITTFYSYNSRGQVEWVVRKDPAIASTKLYNDYDLTGNLTRKRYVDLVTSANNHYFFYEYDEGNRLAHVQRHGFDGSGEGEGGRLQIPGHRTDKGRHTGSHPGASGQLRLHRAGLGEGDQCVKVYGADALLQYQLSGAVLHCTVQRQHCRHHLADQHDRLPLLQFPL